MIGIMRRLCCLACLLSVLVAPAAASELDDALFAYDHGAGPHAVELLTPLAEAGEVKAQEALLHIYAYGEGVSADEKLTYKWSLRAAEQGSPIGENSLGVTYDEGQAGVDKNPAEAKRLFQQAAAKGNAKARYSLGLNYLLGRTEKPDPIMAIAYFEASADAGYELGRMMTALLLSSGQYGVLKDDAMAAHYYELAAETGNLGAATALELRTLRPDAPADQAAQGIKWLLLAERGGCETGTALMRLLAPHVDPAAVVAGARLADGWAKAHPRRDPHVHAEDRLDGCLPLDAFLGQPFPGA